VTVITIASTKGGVGKTQLSFELSAALGAVLVDLDWHAGGGDANVGSPTPRLCARATLGRP
jgi:MinD-like ATPase involved in chromosome partitioning or flagellar assembly